MERLAACVVLERRKPESKSAKVNHTDGGLAGSTFPMHRYEPRDVTGTLASVGRPLLNIARAPYATKRRGAARRRLTLYPVSRSRVSRKREADTSNRVRAKRLSRLLPSAGSCTAAGPQCGRRVGSNEQVSRGLRVRADRRIRQRSSRRSSHVRGATADFGILVSPREGSEATRRIEHGSARGSSCSSLVEKSRVSRTRNGAKPSSVKRQVDRLTRAIPPAKSCLRASRNALLAIVRDRSRCQRAMEGWLAVRKLTTRKFHARAFTALFRQECNSRSRFLWPFPAPRRKFDGFSVTSSSRSLETAAKTSQRFHVKFLAAS